MATRRERALRAAEKLVKKGRLEAAIDEFRKVLKEAPGDTRTLNRVGDLYARLNRVDEAVELFSQAAERFTAEGFFVKAIAIYKKILRLDPTRMPVYQSLAELYQQQGLATEARAQYHVVADYYEKAGDSAAVMSVYERLVELDPGDHEIRVQLADQLAEAKRGEEALEQYGSIAMAQLEGGAADEALSVLSRALEQVPDNLQFVMQTVIQLQAKQVPKLVERFLAKAEEHNPEASQARGLLQRAVATEPPAEAPSEEPSGAAASAPEAPASAAAAEQEPSPGEAIDVLEEAVAAEVSPEAPEAPPEVPESPPAALEASPEAPLAPPEAPGAPPAPDVPEEAAEAPAEPPSAGSESTEAVAEVPDSPEEPGPAEALETDEFEIELDAFEEALNVEEAVAVEPAQEAEPVEETPVFDLESVEEEEPAEAEEEPVAVLEDIAEILGEADALASYGLDEKAIERIERAIQLEPGHLGAYRRLIGIQLNARRDEQVVRLAAQAASAALESGNAGVWRQIVGDLSARGFRIEGSKIIPPPPPPPVEDTPAELLVDEPEPRAESEPEAVALEEPLEGAKEAVVETAEPEVDEAEPVESMLPAAGGGDFFDLGAELELELGDDSLIEEGAELESQSIEEIVEGFKQGMAEVLSPEAYDTHYNLGIAYREMGLVDEAIGEFQLAAKDPRYLVECCSMLGSCFREKDFSDLALKWYRKGLESPAITEEETLGLLYEMGNLHLVEGDREAALTTFTEIYGNNSNFRDVVAKLEELRRGS